MCYEVQEDSCESTNSPTRLGDETRLVALLTCITALSCSGTTSRQPVVELLLEPYVGRLVTVTTVVDGDTLPFLFDSGGGQTLITPELATRLGCTPKGRGVGFRMSGERVEFSYCPDVTLELSGQRFDHEEIAVFDIASLLPSDWPPLAGVVSLKTFADRTVTLDLQRRRLVLESDESLDQQRSKMTKVPSRIATGPDGRSITVFVRMKAPAAGWYLLDTGNLDVVLVSTHLLGDTVPPADGSAQVTAVELEGLAPVEARWRGREIIYNGVLSEEFIRKFILTIDVAHSEVWVASSEHVEEP